MFNLISSSIPKEQRPAEGDLVLQSGVFQRTKSGVVVRLRPPLAKLSGHYDWRRFPHGLAALKVLTVGECDIEPVVSMFGLTSADLAQLDHGLGKVDWYIGDNAPVFEHESDLCDDVDRAIRWGVALAKSCPYSSVANALSRLPSMDGEELHRYVGAWVHSDARGSEYEQRARRSRTGQRSRASHPSG